MAKQFVTFLADGDYTMTPIEPDHPAARARQLRFDRYVLDLERGYLLLEDAEITLRPKTFAVLRFLLENSGRLVSKDELFGAVWPNISVTDDVLVQSIGELRRALADDGQRLIKTISRRGYRLESVVSASSSANSPALDGGSAAASTAEGIPASTPCGEQRTPASKLQVGWRRLAAGLAIAFLLFGVVLLTYHVGREVRSNAQSAKTEEVGAKPAIAILPLVNLGADASRDYFADGLTQDIINALGRFRGLTVMSWNAVFPYRAKPASPAEIARNLAVRYQVEGNVRQKGDRVHATTQLVDANGQVLAQMSAR